jgi:hypothetical protein
MSTVTKRSPSIWRRALAETRMSSVYAGASRDEGARSLQEEAAR